MSDERIIENVKKLQALGMDNQEIIQNLIKIGLSKEESEKLISKTNLQEQQKTTEKESIKDIERKKELDKIEEKKQGKTIEKKELEKAEEKKQEKTIEKKQEKAEEKKQEKTIEKKQEKAEEKKQEIKKESKNEDEIPDNFFNKKDFDETEFPVSKEMDVSDSIDDVFKKDLEKLDELKKFTKDKDVDFKFDYEEYDYKKEKDTQDINDKIVTVKKNDLKSNKKKKKIPQKIVFEKKIPKKENLDLENEKSANEKYIYIKDDLIKENKTDDYSIEDIWQKGLLTTINSKLTELENKQKNIEKLLETKINIELGKIEKYYQETTKNLNKNISEIVSKETDKINAKLIVELTKFRMIETNINTRMQTIESEKIKTIELKTNLEKLQNELNKKIIDINQNSETILENTNKNIAKIISNVTIKLNDKIKEINSTLALQTKITEGLIKNTQNTISKEMKQLDDFQKNVKNEISPEIIYNKIEELENYKNELLKKYNHKFENVINAKVKEKIKEINTTLELQTKITEGLVKNTQNIISKEIEKINIYHGKIREQIDPKQIYEKINELEKYKITLSNRYEERFEKVKKEFLEKAKNAMQNEINNEFRALNKIKEDIVSKTDPQRIENKLSAFKQLGEDVINSVDAKIEQSIKIYQAAMIKEFKEKMSDAEKFIDILSKSKELQKELENKIEEMESYKKQFLAVIDENIEKMNENMKILLEHKKNK